MKMKQMKSKLLRGQTGSGLIETLVAVGILGFIGVGFLSGLWTISHNAGIYDERVTASALARTQAEEIKATPYDPEGNYPEIACPPHYDISISAVELELGKQEVTVTVSRDGDSVLQLTTTKTDWQ